MARTRRTYTPEFKAEAVKLVTEQGYSVAEAARSLGICDNLLRNSLSTFRGELQTRESSILTTVPLVVLGKVPAMAYRINVPMSTKRPSPARPEPILRRSEGFLVPGIGTSPYNHLWSVSLAER